MLNFTDVGEGEELLFIHGLGGRQEAWNPQLPLSENHRLIIVELRGHGNSVGANHLTVEQFAADIIEVLDYLKIDQAHICGLSLGGLVAQEIHKRYKSRVKSLILSNTVFCIPSIVGNFALIRTKKLIGFDRQDQQMRELAKTCLHDHKDESKVDLLREAFLIRNDTYYASAKSAFDRNYYFYLFDIRVPVTIIGSFEDKVTPIFNAYLMHNAIRHARLVIFHRTGHLSNVDNPAAFNQAIHKHIRSYRLHRHIAN